MRVTAATLIGVTTLLVAPAWALATTIDFDGGICSELTTVIPAGGSCPGATTLSSLTYSNGGLTVVATGWSATNTSTPLFVKNAGAGEHGLGIASETSHEITSPHFVNLNVSNLFTNGFTRGTLTLQLESVEGDTYKVCVGNAPGTFGSSFCQSAGPGGSSSIALVYLSMSDMFNNSFPDIGITGTTGDVLVDSVTVPEPSSIGLVGIGLVGVLLLRRRFSVGLH